MSTDPTTQSPHTSAQPLSPQQSPLWFSRSAHRLLVLLALLMAGFSVAPVGNAFLGWKNKDYDLWYETGRLTAAGEVLYPTDGRPFPFMYPPSCASMLAILSYVGEPAFVFTLDALNSAAWIGAILLSIYLVVGRVKGVHWVLYVLPTSVALPFIHDTFLLGQPNLLLLTAMLGAFACLRAGRGGLAGVLIAFGAAVKAFPILALGYLLWRRSWKAVGSTVLALVLFLLVLPLPFRGPTKAWNDLNVWTCGMVLKYDSHTIAQRPVRSFSFKNQSVQALANRLLRDVPADGEQGDTWQVNLASLDFRAVNLVVLGLAGFLGLTYILVMPYGARRNRSTDSAETAMLLCLILAFSPLSFDYFFVWLLYPLTVATALALDAPSGSSERKKRTLWITLAVALLALSIPWRREAQAFGNLQAGSLLLFTGLAVSMRHLSRKSVGLLPEPIQEPSTSEPPSPASIRRRRRIALAS
ncbi:MAG TPA: glycosyltransferase family 87 protein, partial [Isosphaeraceae bacterium]|nr:glycosyltransferase family 87 protein [Isosphaeraceae bacterium]